MGSIADLERISLSMWNATEEIEYDGWILRFAGGYTSRANSVQTYGASALPLEQKVTYCEAMYAERHIPIVFKMTNASQPTDLESFLYARGYAKRNTSSVQLVDMTDKPFVIDSACSIVAGNARDGIFPSQIARWMQHAQCIKQISAQEDSSHQAILARLSTPTGYGVIHDVSGEVVGVGISAYDPQYQMAWIFDIAVHPDYRRHGYGRKLTTSLLAWAKEQGANKIALQVDMSNEKALPLYASLGFVEHHQYWYLHQPKP